MPTIDELPPAVSVSDTDELVVSQSDVARSATRAQLLAGLQPALAVPSGNLLGRLSAGIGAPEAITIGANLFVGNGALSAPPPFTISALPSGSNPMLADAVPISQGGQNTAISYTAFMAGLNTIPGIDGTNITAKATGAGVSRRIADSFADALSVESFGAVGDGVTDDTLAFVAALGSGRPLRLDGRTYIVNGPLVITTPIAIVGIVGQTVITRNTLTSTTTWVSITASTININGVKFDAGGLGGADMPAVYLASSCSNAVLSSCTFTRAIGVTSGSGLANASMAGASIRFEQCRFTGNALHGADLTGSGSADVLASVASGNGGSGLCIEAGVSCCLRDNSCSGNRVGISVGDWSAGAAAKVGGATCSVTANLANGNALWGVAIAAVGALIDSNIMQGNGTPITGGGVLARLGASRLSGNLVSGGTIGIDGRGCWGTSIGDNHVSDTGTGVSVGGSQNLIVSGNLLLTNTWGVVISAIEPGLSFMPTGPITATENWIGFTGAQGGGISVLDGAQGVAICNNDINGWGSATPDQALWLHTDAAVLRHNRWNNQSRFKVLAGAVAGLETLVVPDTADEVLVTSAPGPIASILTNHQADTLGQISFIKMTSSGSGYTQAQVTIAGAGAGASAMAVVGNGQVVWIVLTNPGSGYGEIGSTATVTISGDGVGAAATAYVGLPVLEGRQLRLSCNCQVQLTLSGASPAQESWTGYTSTIPANGAVDLDGVFGEWRAVLFPPVDYVMPTGDGGAILQSVGAANLVLRPGMGGALHIANATETVGCTSSVGRGSPLGLIIAPPGSDFRNLNGGAGNTYWIKQANTDATGWIALA